VTQTSFDTPLTRRGFLGAAGAAGLAVAVGCSSNHPSRDGGDGKGGEFQGQKLRMFIYSGGTEKTLRETFLPRFEARTGATVVFDPGWWDSIPKLKASPPGQPAFDLVLTDATQGCPAIKEGLFQKIDLSRIPNTANLNPSVLDTWVYKEGYGITFPDSVMAIAYNKELIDFEPKSWGDLLKDSVKGKLGLYNSFYMSLYTFACMKVSQEGKPGAAHAEVSNNLKGVFDFAKAHRDRVKFWWPTSTDMVLNLTQKNCAIGNMHSPGLPPLLREKQDLGAVVPVEDRAFVQLMWVIPEGTKRKALAEEAMNVLLSEEVQTGFARNGSMTANLSIGRKMAEEDSFWKQIYPSTEEQLKAIQYYPYETYFKDWDNIVATWDQEVLRKAG
jgi:putative spermidine/putrescine transport system substrate-binding protein